MAYANFSNYKIIFSKTAEKFLDKLDLKTKQHILLKIKELKTNNQNLDIKKLKSRNILYRLRIGSFKIIYTLRHEVIIIYIVVIGYRKDIYQKLNLA